MDAVIFPDNVDWISEPVTLQEASEYIKRLVGIFQRIVYDVIDPQDPNLILCKTAIARSVASIENWSCDYQSHVDEREIKLPNELVDLLEDDFEKICTNDEGMRSGFNRFPLMPGSDDVCSGSEIMTNSNSPDQDSDLQSKTSDFHDECSNGSGTRRSQDFSEQNEEESQSFSEKQYLQVLMAAYQAALTDYKNDLPRPLRRESCNEEILGEDSDSDMDNVEVESILPHSINSESQMSNLNEDIKLNAAGNSFPIPIKNATVSKYKPVHSVTTPDDQSLSLFNQDSNLLQSSSSRSITFDPNSSVSTIFQPKSYLTSIDQFVSKSEHDVGYIWKATMNQERVSEEIRREVLQKSVDESKLLEDSQRDQLLVDTENDFVISVSVFCPVEKEYISKKHKARYGEPKRLMQFKLLSTNNLAQFRDFIVCQNDLLGLKDVYHPQYLKEEHLNKFLARKMYPTGIMFINDTIYNDMRDEKAKDAASVIKNWADSTPSKHIGPFKIGEMSETCIKDLQIRFGYPYVYIHLGTCEHIIVFKNARKLNKTDPVYKNSYPCLEGKVNFKNIFCRVDEEYLASWAVMDYDRFPENPMLLCTKCLESFCYDEDGKKIGTFKLYPFKQAARMLS